MGTATPDQPLPTMTTLKNLKTSVASLTKTVNQQKKTIEDLKKLIGKLTMEIFADLVKIERLVNMAKSFEERTFAQKKALSVGIGEK